MKKMMDLRFAWVVSLSVFLQPSFGQTNEYTSAKTERDLYSSIASYPTDLRSSVLTVAGYPEALVKIERIQSRSSQSFQDLISGYPREEQEKFYELSRYPDRLKDLVRNGKKNHDAAASIVADLPKESQSSILYIYENHFKDLAKIDYIYQSSDENLHRVVSDYPRNVQEDFQKVISRPEVMNLLTDNIDLTTSLGEDYRENPGSVVSQLDSLQSVQQQNLADYKREVENNPEMQKELESAADRFSSSYSGSDSPVDSYLGNQSAIPASPPVVNNYYYNYNPYPYWFSYPYWYATPIWYPVPYYYHTGFYYGSGGRLVVFGFPSFSYSNWFFSFGYRHYPHLYSRYDVYYRPSYTYRGHYGSRYGQYASRYSQYGGRDNHQTYGRYSTTGRSSGYYDNRSSRYGNTSRTNQSRSGQDNRGNRSQIYSSPSTYNRSSSVNSMSRTTVPNHSWMRSGSSTTRTYVPLQPHNSFIRPSNPGGRMSSPQFNSGSSGRSGFQHSGGGGGGGSRSSGGSHGGGGGGHRGR